MLNRITIIGRLASDVALQYLESGTAIAEFRIAHNRRYKREEEWKEEAHFFDVKSYGKMAKNLPERLAKGYQVVIEGRLAQERWTGQDGKKYSRVRIIADAVRILNKPKAEDEQATEEQVEEQVEHPKEKRWLKPPKRLRKLLPRNPIP